MVSTDFFSRVITYLLLTQGTSTYASIPTGTKADGKGSSETPLLFMFGNICCATIIINRQLCELNFFGKNSSEIEVLYFVEDGSYEAIVGPIIEAIRVVSNTYYCKTDTVITDGIFVKKDLSIKDLDIQLLDRSVNSSFHQSIGEVSKQAPEDLKEFTKDLIEWLRTECEFTKEDAEYVANCLSSAMYFVHSLLDFKGILQCQNDLDLFLKTCNVTFSAHRKKLVDCITRLPKLDEQRTNKDLKVGIEFFMVASKLNQIQVNEELQTLRDKFDYAEDNSTYKVVSIHSAPRGFHFENSLKRAKANNTKIIHFAGHASSRDGFAWSQDGPLDPKFFRDCLNLSNMKDKSSDFNSLTGPEVAQDTMYKRVNCPKGGTGLKSSNKLLLCFSVGSICIAAAAAASAAGFTEVCSGFMFIAAVAAAQAAATEEAVEESNMEHTIDLIFFNSCNQLKFSRTILQDPLGKTRKFKNLNIVCWEGNVADEVAQFFPIHFYETLISYPGRISVAFNCAVIRAKMRFAIEDVPSSKVVLISANDVFEEPEIITIKGRKNSLVDVTHRKYVDERRPVNVNTEIQHKMYEVRSVNKLTINLMLQEVFQRLDLISKHKAINDLIFISARIDEYLDGYPEDVAPAAAIHEFLCDAGGKIAETIAASYVKPNREQANALYYMLQYYLFLSAGRSYLDRFQEIPPGMFKRCLQKSKVENQIREGLGRKVGDAKVT
jgi:hypothetical protein